MWLQNRILEPKPRKNNFEAFFGISKAGTSSAPNAKTNLLKLYPGNLEAATALQSAKTELQGTKAQCESTHKEESPLETSVTVRALFEQESNPERRCPQVSWQANLLVSAPEHPFTRNKTMFRANSG